MIKARTTAFAALFIGVVALSVCGVAAAQTVAYPMMPIKVIVPFVGGTSDLISRVLGEKVSADLGQPVVVENRGGAGGSIGTQAVIRSKPDGYTLLSFSAANAIYPLLQKSSYDPERELTPVIGFGSVSYGCAVNGKSNIRSIADLAALAKSTPGGINYSSGGTGSPSHLAPARLARALKIDATHVPFQGTGGAVQAVLANQVHFICATTPDVIAYAKSGDLRLFAVTSEQRLAELPDVPTMVELGFANFYASTWHTIQAPPNTPKSVVDRLYNAYAKAMTDPAVLERFRSLGMTVKVRNGSELAAFMKEDIASWRRVIEDNQIKLEN